MAGGESRTEKKPGPKPGPVQQGGCHNITPLWPGELVRIVTVIRRFGSYATSL